MAPLETEAGRLWTNPESPCICTHSLRAAIATRLACRTIIGLSSAQPLNRIHTAFAPPSLIRLIQREAYSPQWRDAVRKFLETSEAGARDDLVSVKLRGHIVFAAV